MAAVKSKYVASAKVEENGVITITSQNITQGGKSSFTYVLTPTVETSTKDGTGSALNWTSSGDCVDADLCFGTATAKPTDNNNGNNSNSPADS